MTKLDYIMKHADFSLKDKVWTCDYCSIVGTFAGGGFEADSKEDAARKVVDYFDGEYLYEGETMVNYQLKEINWSNYD